METLTIKQASKRFSIGTSTIQSWFNKGLIALAGIKTTRTKSAQLFYKEEIEQQIKRRNIERDKNFIVAITRISPESHRKLTELASKNKTSLSRLLAKVIKLYFHRLEDFTKTLPFFASKSPTKGVQIDLKLLHNLKIKIKQLNLSRDYKQRVTIISLIDILVDKYYKENIE